jgi:hypothetical protein
MAGHGHGFTSLARREAQPPGVLSPRGCFLHSDISSPGVIQGRSWGREMTKWRASSREGSASPVLAGQQLARRLVQAIAAQGAEAVADADLRAAACHGWRALMASRASLPMTLLVQRRKAALSPRRTMAR